MEKEKWMQEFEKKQSRKRGYEDDDEDVGEGDDDKDSQFFKLADKTLMRMTNKDDSADITDDAGDAFKPKPQQDNKVFKSPTNFVFAPVSPAKDVVQDDE